MYIVLCATQNMYCHLFQSIEMLLLHQPNLEHIYAIVEDDFIVKIDKVTFINVKNYPKIINNKTNNKNFWTYISYARCYLAEILPDIDKVLYLDLDVFVEKDLTELWNTNIENKALAGVVDMNARNHRLTYIKNINSYINSGVLLMNLKYFKEHNITEKLHELLNTWIMFFPDQDALNIACYKQIKFLSHKWNSGYACGEHDEAIIHHCYNPKPWDPNSEFFKKWVINYFNSMEKYLLT